MEDNAVWLKEEVGGVVICRAISKASRIPLYLSEA